MLSRRRFLPPVFTAFGLRGWLLDQVYNLLTTMLSRRRFLPPVLTAFCQGHSTLLSRLVACRAWSRRASLWADFSPEKSRCSGRLSFFHVGRVCQRYNFQFLIFAFFSIFTCPLCPH